MDTATIPKIDPKRLAKLQAMPLKRSAARPSAIVNTYEGANESSGAATFVSVACGPMRLGAGAPRSA